MIDGCFVVDKPSGMTSHDVVGKVRRIVQQRRVGHAGTLDPSATGVLIVAVGRTTRLMKYATALQKTYEGELVLGATTTTLDADGEVVERFDMRNVTNDDVQAAASKFVGDILQVPPMVSALKVNGQRLHALAREGIEVERTPRPVTIAELVVAPIENALVRNATANDMSLQNSSVQNTNIYSIKVTCSSGTYIRSLCADIGTALGGGAFLQHLRRTAIGTHAVEDAATLDDVAANVHAHLRPSLAMVAHLPRYAASHDELQRIAVGKSLAISSVIVDSDVAAEQMCVAVTDGESDELVAVYRRVGGGAHAHAADPGTASTACPSPVTCVPDVVLRAK